jgi:citronellol/citronellal dehydrogenase
MTIEKYACVTGASRGIGAQIAQSLAQKGYHVAIIAKTKDPHPKLKGTLDETASKIEEHGVKALAIQADLRDPDQVTAAFDQITEKFGRLDILVNNASAISLTPTDKTSAKKFDLMQQVNGRATFLCSQAAFPLMKENGGHILMMSPPLSMEPKWFAPHLAYTISKYTMSMCVLGLSAEWRKYNIAVNALWPQTLIATAAIEFNFPPELMKKSRHAQIVSDALCSIVEKDPQTATGLFYTDEQVLREAGIEDFSHYAVDSESELMTDLYL